MPELVHDCPRCGANRITFDVAGAATFRQLPNSRSSFEIFGVCRHCELTTIFKCQSKSGIHKDVAANYLQKAGIVNSWIDVGDYVSVKDNANICPPEHLPEEIEAFFIEAATCAEVRCFNAAGTMYRLCLDKATLGLLPEDGVDGLNSKIRRSLGLRLIWLFETRRIDPALQELSHCIKEDGNDGAHQGGLNEDDVEDIRDFTEALLERLFSYPERLKIAANRRVERRAP